MSLNALNNTDWENSEKLAKAMQEINWSDPAERREVALTVIKFVKEDITKEDFIPVIADVENFPLGQTPQWIVKRGMKAYVHEPGSIAPRSFITQKTFTMQTEMVSVAYEIELGQLRAGRYGSLSEIRKMMTDELVNQRYQAVWNVLRGSITAGTNYLPALTTNSLQAKKDCLISGLDYCEDQQGGPPKAIIGRRSQLGFITELPGYAETTKTKIDNDGFLGAFRGIPVIALRQYTDVYGLNQIDADSIFIVKPGTIKVGRTQEVQVEEAFNIDDLMWHWHAHERYGTLAINAERNFRIEFTDI